MKNGNREKIRTRWINITTTLNLTDAVSESRFEPGSAGEPWLDVDATMLDVVYSERGIERSREHARNLDELMYLFTRNFTFEMACRHEVANRDRSRDPRRMIFAEAIRLLSLVDDGWAEIEKARQEIVLKNHPFQDGRA